MKPLFYLSAILSYLLPLALPLFQMSFQFLYEPRVNGYENQVPWPSLDWTSWNEGSYQKEVENWLHQNMGLRGWMVRFDNQLNLSLFRELDQQKNIIVGRNQWLHDKGYIDPYMGKDKVPDQQLENSVKQMRIVQDLLAQHQVAFLFIMSPNKARVYPETLPDGYLNPKKTNYESLMELLKKYGVHFIDGNASLIEFKRTSPYDVFVRGGVHWSHYGACLFTQKLVLEMEQLLHQKLGILDCSVSQVDYQPTGTDRDYATLLNLLTPEYAIGPTAHPKATWSHPKKVLNVLEIGSSFLHNINDLITNPLTRQLDFYYYYKRNIPYRSSSQSIPPKEEFKSVLLQKDIVLLENNEGFLFNVDFGFLEDALYALQH
ncbi:hypothetical protein WDW89_20750 [Deltaproteobacteria bacterium TL4]